MHQMKVEPLLEHCTIQTVDGLTTIHFSRAPTIGEAKIVIDKLADERSYHLRLWDFGDIFFNFSMDEIREIAEYGKSKFLEPNRMALVAPQDLAFGTLRAFEVYRQEDTHSIPRVFRAKAEAIDWLAEQRTLLKSNTDDPNSA
ncbi:hypothetical protein D3OALGA1CA_844 [Olavius algarvensis associated proteobacterium Delta 3]|nr:hypothetical protein D3OALGA1CA_844 [Olavius algarvensis associated proteobacterium Delta 3]CAB5143011.1 hypothetical protein D3OALGB2SA_4347 [Olavius algarvensis associated proteobacterium Delta 3]